MSRKLLMNNYSENGLSPVMDGLICWLDGRDGRNGDTVWKDRSGNGNDFEVTNCQWGETSLKTHTTSSYFNLEKLLINRNDDFCLDIYFKQSINQVGNLRVINANSESVWVDGSSIFIENDNKIFYYCLKTNCFCDFSFRYLYFLYNLPLPNCLQIKSN